MLSVLMHALQKTNEKRFIAHVRKRNKNLNPTIVSNNCIAGIIYHNLGLKFSSPTINLFIKGQDFLLFATYFSKYIDCELAEKETDLDYPVGILLGEKYKLPNIEVNFLHYKSFLEAKEKWLLRCKRVNLNNLYFIWEFYDTAYDVDLIKQFDKLNYNTLSILHKVIDGVKNYEIANCYNNDEPTGKILQYKSKFSGKRFLDEIDYVSFLNK